MKKQSLLFVAGSMLALASCQNEGANTGGFTQEQVDSIVNARVNEQMMQQQAMNDSIINAMAAYKADSIVAAMKGGSVTTRTTTTKTTTVKPTTPEKPTKPTNPKDDRFNGTQNNTTQKDARFNEDAAQKAKEESAKKKADRFNK